MCTQQSGNNKIHTRKNAPLTEVPTPTFQCTPRLTGTAQLMIPNADPNRGWGTPGKRTNQQALSMNLPLWTSPSLWRQGKPLHGDMGSCELLEGIPKSDACQKAGVSPWEACDTGFNDWFCHLLAV